MIEYALLFALGFLAAGLLGLLIAPVVHKRVVRFAEDRLKATMPLSPQEVRAQKDAARAGYAAENARTTQVLKRERDKNVGLMLENGNILKEAQRLTGENADLHAQLADMNVEAADLRSSARQMEQSLERLRTTLAAVEKDNVKKTNDLKALTRQLDHVSATMDSVRIGAAAGDTEIESLKARIAALRDEREALRTSLKAETDKIRGLETRARLDENRIRQFETNLAKEVSANADKDNFLERRGAEVERLKIKVKETGADLREAAAALRAAGLTMPTPRAREQTEDTIMPTVDEQAETASQAELADLTRNRAAALAERLMNAKSGQHDDAMRAEMADIAVGMVALTLAREGDRSPIPSILEAAAPRTDGQEKGLSRRVRELLQSSPDQP